MKLFKNHFSLLAKTSSYFIIYKANSAFKNAKLCTIHAFEIFCKLNLQFQVTRSITINFDFYYSDSSIKKSACTTAKN